MPPLPPGTAAQDAAVSRVIGEESDPDRIGVIGRNTGDNAFGFLAGKDPIFDQDVGVYGASDDRGVFGRSADGTGVTGSSDTGNGVLGYSSSGAGVVGVANSVGPGMLAYGSLEPPRPPAAGRSPGRAIAREVDPSSARTGPPSLVASLVDPAIAALGRIQEIIKTNPGLAALFAGDVVATGTITAADVVLSGADCAEEFDVADARGIEPGSVVVIDDTGELRTSHEPYDKRVAGVISGAGSYAPGLILDRRASDRRRVPVALVGKVYCKVDAAHAPIEVGDLLTTSETAGCAMKARDASRAYGSILGKALAECQDGNGLIPILVTLT